MVLSHVLCPLRSFAFFSQGAQCLQRIICWNKTDKNSLLHGIYMSLFTQVYTWVPATYCWGVTQRWTSIPARGSSNTPRQLHAKETGISSGSLGLWLVCAFTFTFTLLIRIRFGSRNVRRLNQALNILGRAAVRSLRFGGKLQTLRGRGKSHF